MQQGLDGDGDGGGGGAAPSRVAEFSSFIYYSISKSTFHPSWLII